jgi:hypothetical protein
LWLVGVLIAGAFVGRQVALAVARRAEAAHDAGPADALFEAAPEAPHVATANPRAGVLGSVRDFVHEVRVGMREREAQIRDAFAAGVSIDDAGEPDDTWRRQVLGHHA